MNPDPLPPRVGCEHPAFSAVFDKLLSEVPPIQAPPLEAARRTLERAERLAADAREDGTENQYLNALHDVAIARAEVRRLEREAIQ